MSDVKWSEWVPVYRASDMPTDKDLWGQWRGDDGFVSSETELCDIGYSSSFRTVVAYRYRIEEPTAISEEDEEECLLLAYERMSNAESLAKHATMAGQDPYSAYFKDVRHIDTIDVYRVVSLFDCEKHGHPISHAAKKLLLSGSRTGGKDVESDVREAIDTLHRWLEMREEDKNAV